MTHASALVEPAGAVVPAAHAMHEPDERYWFVRHAVAEVTQAAATVDPAGEDAPEGQEVHAVPLTEYVFTAHRIHVPFVGAEPAAHDVVGAGVVHAAADDAPGPVVVCPDGQDVHAVTVPPTE